VEMVVLAAAIIITTCFGLQAVVFSLVGLCFITSVNANRDEFEVSMVTKSECQYDKLSDVSGEAGYLGRCIVTKRLLEGRGRRHVPK